MKRDPWSLLEVGLATCILGVVGVGLGVAGSNTTLAPSPATTIMLFDSTVLTRNATAPTTTLPIPPRYGANNTIAYLDGHVP